MENIFEYLSKLDTDSLIELSRESDSSNFPDDSHIRFLVSHYKISTNDFITGVMGLRNLILTELTRRHFTKSEEGNGSGELIIIRKLRVDSFKYAGTLVNWVNEQEDRIEIVSITSKGAFEGEGYTIFYYEK